MGMDNLYAGSRLMHFSISRIPRGVTGSGQGKAHGVGWLFAMRGLHLGGYQFFNWASDGFSREQSFWAASVEGHKLRRMISFYRPGVRVLHLQKGVEDGRRIRKREKRRPCTITRFSCPGLGRVLGEPLRLLWRIRRHLAMLMRR